MWLACWHKLAAIGSSKVQFLSRLVLSGLLGLPLTWVLRGRNPRESGRNFSHTMIYLQKLYSVPLITRLLQFKMGWGVIDTPPFENEVIKILF